MGRYVNLAALKTVAEALSQLRQKVVFVGGSVVELYCDDPARGEARPTDDIDVVVEILSRGSHADLEYELRQIGFRHDIESGINCRFKYKDIIVDIMPTDAQILGFTNRWYKAGINNTISAFLDEKVVIEIFSLPYFLASKAEALKSERHGADFRFNSDFEDIIYIFDNCTTIVQDILQAENEIQIYLINELSQLLNRPFIEEEVVSNLGFSNTAKRSERIIAIWRSIIEAV